MNNNSLNNRIHHNSEYFNENALFKLDLDIEPQSDVQKKIGQENIFTLDNLSNLGLPFDDGLSISSLKSGNWFGNDKLIDSSKEITEGQFFPANLLHVNKQIAKASFHSVKRKALYCDEMVPVLYEIEVFSIYQSTIIKDFISSNLENLQQKLFAYFCKYVDLNITSFPDKNPSYFSQSPIRSFKFDIVILYPIFYFWVESKDAPEKRIALEAAVKNLCRLLRITDANLYKTQCLEFDEWLTSNLSSITHENIFIEKELSPTKGYKSDIEMNEALEKIYVNSMLKEIAKISKMSFPKISEITDLISSLPPYCQKKIQSQEYLLYKQKEIYGLHILRIEKHSAPFYLTYFANRNQLHSWGHYNPTRRQYCQNSLKELKIVPSRTTYYIQDLKKIWKTTSCKKHKKMLKILIQSTNKHFKYKKIGKEEYTPCLKKCSKITFLDKINNSLVIVPENWNILNANEKIIAIEIFENLHKILCSKVFAINLSKAISSQGIDKYWNLDINNDYIYKAISPVICTAIVDESPTNSVLFALNKFFKIFNIYSSDIKVFQNKAISTSDKWHMSLVKIALPERPMPQKPYSTVIYCKFFNFILDVKNKEFNSYCKHLKEHDVELSLKFEPKRSILIGNKSDSELSPIEDGYIISHDFGFSHFSQSTIPLNDAVSDKLRILNKYNSKNALDYHSEKNESKKTKNEILLELFEFIDACWKQNNFIIPLLPMITPANYQKNKQSNKEKLKLEEVSGNKSMIKMHGKFLTASTPTLKKLINESSKLEQDKTKIKDKAKKENKDIEGIADGVLTFPDFLLDMQMNSSNDFFCKIASGNLMLAYKQIQAELFNTKANTNTLQLFGVPNDGNLITEERHKKASMIDTLREPQKRSVERFEVWKEAGCGGIIADEPGMGKTRTGCELLLRSLIEFPDRPCIVIAPTLVKIQWGIEFENSVNVSAKNLCVKILRSSSSKKIKQKATELYENISKELPLLLKGTEVITEEDLERFALFEKFYKTFPQNPVIAIKTPKECRELISSAQKEPLKGIYILQFSYANQFDLNNPESIAKINPSLVIVDEAHELITLTETLKVGKTTRFDYIFRQWSCTKIGLTATPVVNNIFDICALLTLFTNNERNLDSVEHFERLLYKLANKIADFKVACEIDQNDFVSQSRSGKVGKDMLQTEISDFAHQATLTFLWLKEKMINPRISRSTRASLQVDETIPQTIVRKNFQFKIIPTEAQNNLHDKIFKLYSGNFFKFTSLVSSLLIHPDLIDVRDNKIYKTEIDVLVKKISKMQNPDLVNYINKSGLLSKLFLDEKSQNGEMTIRDAMEKSERALMFVSEIDHAEFIKTIAKKYFDLKNNQVSVIHSQNKTSESEIASFKNLKEKGIQILLPKSGGAGINYTEVVLNIIAAVGWTFKELEQCSGRIWRGKGDKYVGTVAYPFNSALHVGNIVRKKELLSNLFLDVGQIDKENAQNWMLQILDLAESIVRATRDHCKTSEEWDNNFFQMKNTLADDASVDKLWKSYVYEKQKKENPKVIVGSLEIDEYVPEMDIEEEVDQEGFNNNNNLVQKIKGKRPFHEYENTENLVTKKPRRGNLTDNANMFSASSATKK